MRSNTLTLAMFIVFILIVLALRWTLAPVFASPFVLPALHPTKTVGTPETPQATNPPQQTVTPEVTSPPQETNPPEITHTPRPTRTASPTPTTIVETPTSTRTATPAVPTVSPAPSASPSAVLPTSTPIPPTATATMTPVPPTVTVRRPPPEQQKESPVPSATIDQSLGGAPAAIAPPVIESTPSALPVTGQESDAATSFVLAVLLLAVVTIGAGVVIHKINTRG